MFNWIERFESLLSVTAVLFAGAAFAYSWLTSGSKDNASKIEVLEKAVEEKDTELSTRVAALENRLDDYPTKEDLHEIHLQLRTLDGTIGSLSTKVESVDRVARRIDDYLLTQRER
ncbi:MAG: DUF2730 domain-containing protein [Roseibium sp.]|uniref:DUF2730 family protein n=1 Tax=Roseibium sp. TaxID=1936156 RepID=UPI00262820C9|nr:DUF2730 family protein [Roseibium sp.]MCV0428853.1 DUF2730 domain-containing protein [Roseibium sp.]